MKSLLSISLALLVLLQPLHKAGILLDYQLNKEFIARVLCLQKDKPVNTCQGKCHLKKQLAQADETEKRTNTTFKDKTEIIFFCQATALFRFDLSVAADAPVAYYANGYLLNVPSGVFHPPKFAA